MSLECNCGSTSFDIEDLVDDREMGGEHIQSVVGQSAICVNCGREYDLTLDGDLKPLQCL